MKSTQQQAMSKVSTQIGRSDKTMSEGTKQDRDQDSKPHAQPEIPGSARTSTPLHIAIHGISRLTNSRLSSEELDICIELLEAGVHPQALVDVIRNITAVKEEPDSF